MTYDHFTPSDLATNTTEKKEIFFNVIMANRQDFAHCPFLLIPLYTFSLM